MKQLIIDRALALELGESINLSFKEYRSARSFQTGITSALSKVPPQLRGTIQMSLLQPQSQGNITNNYIVELEKVDTYNNATITFKDGTTQSLVEYDWECKRKGEN